MPGRRLWFVGCLIWFVTACAAPPRELPSVAPREAGVDPAGLAQVDSIMGRLVAEKKIAGAVVAIARGGGMVHLKAYGAADLDSGRSMTTDAIFRIYSMTKSIVTAAALTLVDEGKLDLDAPVGHYVSELADLKLQNGQAPKRQPTTRDLMRHTAGFIYRGGPYDKHPPLEAENLDAMAQRLGELPLMYEPGEKWIYSLSIDVVGLVIERISGQKLDTFLQERIFTPLDMKDTGFFVPAEKMHRFTVNYNVQKDGALKQRDPANEKSKYAKKPGLLSGGGGLVSTARDYVRFLSMVQNDGTLHGVRVLHPETVALMKNDQLPKAAFPISFGSQVRHGTGFSLGFSVRTADTEWDPSGRVGEYGWGGFASTHHWVSPKDDLIVVTLEQRVPYTFETEFLLKKQIYDAVSSDR